MCAISSASEPPIHSVPELLDIGPVLRAAREARGLSLAEVASATNVRENFLESLERDDPLEAFPAPVYERFFLREYARFLGIDEEPLVEALEARLGAVEPILEVPPPAVPPPRRWLGKLLVAAAAGGVIFLGVNSVLSNRAPSPAAGGKSPAKATTSPAPTPSPKPSATPVRYNGIQARLRFSERCWVRATVDGKVVAEQIYLPGDSLRLNARRTFILRLGVPSGASLRINGKHISTDGSAATTLSFAWRNGHLVRLAA
jgi:cytoskeletal protein RodZ